MLQMIYTIWYKQVAMFRVFVICTATDFTSTVKPVIWQWLY